MSATPFPELLDAPMHDFAEFDVPMNSAASLDFSPELSMDHDGHGTTYANQEDVEVEMETYDDGNAEYEMADETEELNERHYYHEPPDVEVYDVIDARSPQPTTVSQPLPSLTANPEIPLLSSPASLSEPFTPRLGTIPVEHDASVTDLPLENDSHVTEQIDLGAQQVDVPLPFIDERSSEYAPLPTHAAVENLNAPPTTDSRDIEKHADPLIFVSEIGNEAGSSVQPTAESSLQPRDEEHSETLHRSGTPPKASPQSQNEHHVDDHHEGADYANDPHEISEGVYIDPPPAVFVSVGSSEVPEYCLFNQPPVELESPSPSAGATGSNQEVYLLLLRNRPTLYYEPLSSVFEALRQDDFINKIPEALEGELTIDAYDLQLAVSEDNIYAQEISLHDLNVLHDGSDFAGPLRIHLRSAIPRFILRYRLLQEQISRLDLVAGADEFPDEGYSHTQPHDAWQETDHHEDEARLEAPHPDDQKDDDEAENVHQLQDDDAAANDTTPIPQVVEDTSYHNVSSNVLQALEDEGDYDGTNVGVEYQEDLDSATVHEIADTDATVTASNEKSGFAGQETEHKDYVQPEEYDESYGEDFPEEDSTEYDQTVGYEESGEQDASTAVDGPQAVLYESDLHEADTTPVAPAQLVDSEPTQKSETAGSASNKPGDRLPSYETFKNEKSSHDTDKDLTLDQQTDQPESISQLLTDESDSNFVEMLEREADSELDHYSSNSNAKPTEEGRVETSPALDDEWEKWDDELDADGEADEEWLDPGDAMSNESSVTLSSNSSAKRGHDEVDPENDGLRALTTQSSPEKRPRMY